MERRARGRQGDLEIERLRDSGSSRNKSSERAGKVGIRSMQTWDILGRNVEPNCIRLAIDLPES